MSTTLRDQIFAALAEFSSASRLYALKVGGKEEAGLLVEAFVADDALQEIGMRDVIALSTDAGLDLETLLGQPATLEICLADGKRERFAGEICEAAMLGSDGGLARYRIRIAPWLWRLGQVRNSRVWQDKRVVDIVDAVFAAYRPLARWRWSEDTRPFLEEVRARSYCCQYRESDLDFVRRLLAEEGLCWRCEETDDGPGLVLFADSSRLCAVPEDGSSAAHGGIRFHGARAVEQTDSIQALTAQRRLHASLTTVLSYDYKAKQAVAASSPSHFTYGKLPELESFDVPGQYAYAGWQEAQHYANLRMQEQEARGQLWHGRSTVRTLRAGTRLQVLGAPLQQLGKSASFTVLRVFGIGVNNMPPPVRNALAELFGPIPELLDDLRPADLPDDIGLALAQAQASGYANCFRALATDLVWRPAQEHPKPVAFGAQSAIVVGADGSDQPNGADELYCDRLGRIRIRFHWQDGGNAACWVRVAQRSAGGGMGQQFLPRIGQEVLVQFLENDIDRPIVVGALYNGRGEGGVVATSGGRRDVETDLSCFRNAHDHARSGQGNLCGGNGPVWHGASADSAGHRNPASQWGIRSKEFGGYGYSQLVFDDSDGRGRVQLKSTHAGSELNLGHLVHAADNYRGSFRGSGAELRTDEYGAVRAGAGLLVSSYKLEHSAASRDPSGENAAGVALMQQADAMGKAFNSAACTHKGVALAAHVGSTKANESVLDPATATLKAMSNCLSGVSSSKKFQASLEETGAENTSVSGGKAPNFTDPIVAVAAQNGFGTNAGQDVQLENGEAAIFLSGQDAQLSVGAQVQCQSKQAIGLLSGTIKSGAANVGMQIVTAKDAVDIQSQASELKINAKSLLNLFSASAHIDFAAAKTINVTTAGGASITIEAGNILMKCPGLIKVQAGKKSFVGPARTSYPMPALPGSICVECLKKSLDAGPAFTLVE
ncbi:type VI secretion system tip protein VgrG [Massilia sp. UMI-21]|nr:type VI secretion system tip protein VgrG [Massilia sp. UMI-21]